MTERKNGDLVRNAIQAGMVSACHDLSDGGILIGVTEMAMAEGIGATIDMSNGDIPAYAWLFGEDQARYIVATSKPETVLAMAAEAGVTAAKLGTTGGDAVSLSSGESIKVKDLKTTNESWMPDFMG